MKNELYTKLVNKGETPYFTSEYEMDRNGRNGGDGMSRSRRDVEESRFVRSPHLESSPEMIRSNMRKSRSSRKKIFNQSSQSPLRHSRDDTLNLSYSRGSGEVSRSRRRIFDSGISSFGGGGRNLYQSQPQMGMTGSVMLGGGKEMGGNRKEESEMGRREEKREVDVESRLSQSGKISGFEYHKVEKEEEQLQVKTAVKSMSHRRNNEVYLPRSEAVDPRTQPKGSPSPMSYLPSNQPYRTQDTPTPRPKSTYESPHLPPSHRDYLDPASYLHPPSPHTYF